MNQVERRFQSALSVWLWARERAVTVKPPGIGLKAREPPCMSQWLGRLGHMKEGGGWGKGSCPNPAVATQAAAGAGEMKAWWALGPCPLDQGFSDDQGQESPGLLLSHRF